MKHCVKKEFEVLYMIYPIMDDYGVQQLKEFDWKKLKSVTKEALDVNDVEKKMEEPKAEFEPRTNLMKEVLCDTFGFPFNCFENVDECMIDWGLPSIG